MLQKQQLLGVGITNETIEEVLEYTLKSLKKRQKQFFIVTPNPEILTYAQLQTQYKTILNEAEIALPDGIGIIWSGKLLNKPFKERITGVDFIEMLCHNCMDKPLSMGFLGGRSGVAQATAECLSKKYPWIKVVFIAEEWSERGFLEQESGSKYGQTHIDILFVAFGFPKQEEWIYKNLKNLPVTAAMGVGGSFDYISGNVARAPKFLRILGLEWLFRLLHQPWRIKRQLALVKFIFLIVKEIFKKR